YRASNRKTTSREPTASAPISVPTSRNSSAARSLVDYWAACSRATGTTERRCALSDRGAQSPLRAIPAPAFRRGGLSLGLQPNVLHRFESREIDRARVLFERAHIDGIAGYVHGKTFGDDGGELAVFGSVVELLVHGLAADRRVSFIARVALRVDALRNAAGRIHQTGDRGDVGDLDFGARSGGPLVRRRSFRTLHAHGRLAAAFGV